MHPIAIIFAAMWRPRALVDYLATGRRAVWRTVLTVVVALAVLQTTVLVVVGQFTSLGKNEFIKCLVAAPLIAVSNLTIFFPIKNSYLSIKRHFALCLSHILLTIPPFMAIFWSLESINYLNTTTSLLLNHTSLILIGLWFSEKSTFFLLIGKTARHTQKLRVLCTIGNLIILSVFFLKLLRGREADISIPLICVGFMLGTLQIPNYCWQAPLSLIQSILATCQRSTVQILEWHPVNFDEMSSLPLPGLARLLQQAVQDDLERGCTWLVKVGNHYGHGRVALRVIEQCIQSGRLAHPLLLRLSTTQEGGALLRRLVEQRRHTHPLIIAYTALANIPEPAAWPTVIERHLPAFTAAAQLPGGPVMYNWLSTSAALLQANRWHTAMQICSRIPPHRDHSSDPILQDIESLCTTLCELPFRYTPLEVLDHPQVDKATPFKTIVWIRKLHLTLYEQITFLHQIKHLEQAI